MSLSTIRIQAQVWPAWLPGAIATTAEHQVTSVLQRSVSRTPIPPVVFSAAFQSSLPNNSSTRSAGASLPYHPCHHQLQRPCAFSSSCVRPSALFDAKSIAHARPFSSAASVPPSAPSPPLASSWHTPSLPLTRPITILGSGVLGRRLAVIWASTGQPVTLYDNSPSALASSQPFIADTLSSYCAEQGTLPGKVHFTTSFHNACSPTITNTAPWMVIDCLPEDLNLKISVLGRVDRTVGRDCIIATNSASFRSRDLVSEVQRRERVLNTLYYIPPANRCVELMSCGYTAPNLIPFLTARMQEVGLTPLHVHNESAGMIFPRLFGAMKRETLKILQEGVARPAEIDELFRDFFGAKRGVCRMMDRVGLDTVAGTERRWLAGDEGRGENGAYLEWLETEFVERGSLGEKSGIGLVVGSELGYVADGVDELTEKGEVWKGHAADLSGV